jgi:L-idonate 5-dehydrogenase
VSGSPAPAELLDLELLARQPSGAALARVSASGVYVLIGPTDPCGECEVCRRGGPAVCTNARERDPLATVARISSRWVVQLGDGLEMLAQLGAAAAAIPGDLAIAYTLYARTGLGPRDPVVVTGATSITRFLVAILRAKGLTPVVLTTRPDLVAPGAITVAAASDVTAAITSLGLGARPVRVIATDAASLAIAAELAGPRATLTVLAPAATLPGFLIAREVTIIGVAGAHPDLVTEVAAMCAKGELDLAAGTTTDPDDPTRALVTSLPAR